LGEKHRGMGERNGGFGKHGRIQDRGGGEIVKNSWKEGRFAWGAKKSPSGERRIKGITGGVN